MSSLLRHFKWLSRLLVLALICVFGGGHLAVGQLVAWTIMLVERSQTMTVADAVDSTFSGDAPCARCCQVKKAAQDSQLPQVPESSGGSRVRVGIPLAEALPPSSVGVPDVVLLGDVVVNFCELNGVRPWQMDRSIDMPPWV